MAALAHACAGATAAPWLVSARQTQLLSRLCVEMADVREEAIQFLAVDAGVGVLKMPEI